MVNNDAVDDARDPRSPRRPSRRRLFLGGLGLAAVLTVALGVGPAGALDRLPGPWHPDRDRAGSEHADRGGREGQNDHGNHAECSAAATPGTTTAAPVAGSAAQTATVVVPPIVRVRSASRSDLVVVTNSGRPPAPGDQVYVEAADGRLAPADTALVARVMSARWGDEPWCSTTEEHRATRR